MPSAPFELKNTILRAGAGAGKTTRLVNLFVDYANQYYHTHDKQYPRIVVTTFTRKATQELKERLLERAMRDQNHDLFLYINQKSKVQISTIHGVLSLFLAAHGRRIGLTPDYKIQPEGEIYKQARRVLRSLLLENSQWLELLEEYSFVEIEKVLLQFFDRSFYQKNLRPACKHDFAEMALNDINDFTEKARYIADEILAQPPSESWKKWGEGLQRIGHCQNAEEIPEFLHHLASLRKEELKRKPSVRKETDINPEIIEKLNEFVEKLSDFADEKSNYLYLPQYWEKHDTTNQLFSELSARFREDFLRIKLEKGLLSMTDLESLSLHILETDPSAARLFAQNWDFWMIDEYQDTSPVQVKLLNALVQDQSHFVVGDPQQSIYLFRGARTEVFEQKVEQINKQQGNVEVKLENYRSRPELLQFFNEYFASENKFSPMVPAGQNFLWQSKDPVADILIIDRDKEEQGPSLAEAVIFRIQELLDQGISAEKICVLARKNKILEQIVHEARRYHLPVQLHSATGFYRRREVQDALGVLKFFANPYDEQNLISILRSPWCYYTDAEIYDLCTKRKHSLWSLLQDSELQKYLNMAEVKGLCFALRSFLIDRMVFDYCHYIDPTGRREANLWKLISLLSQEERRSGFNVLEFVNQCGSELSTDEGGDDADATPVIEPKRVNLMTVHASKGLQFDHVIIPSMHEPKRADRPQAWSLQEASGLWSLATKNEENGQQQYSLIAQCVTEEKNQREKEEHKRVLYVALTRARESVSLLWQGKPGAHSWAGLFPFSTEVGLHEANHFIYRIRREKGYQPTRHEVVHEDKLIVSAKLQSLVQKSLPHRSVTGLIQPDRQTKSEQQEFAPEQVQKALRRMQRGTDAHRLFENLKYSSANTVKNMTNDTSLHKAIDFVMTTQEIPLAQIIEQGFVEWGFTLKDAKYILQGQIDLWAKIKNEIWLIDYKTGSIENAEKALEQLKVYAWALHKMKLVSDQEAIHLVAVYPVEGQFERHSYLDYSKLATEVEKIINAPTRDSSFE